MALSANYNRPIWPKLYESHEPLYLRSGTGPVYEGALMGQRLGSNLLEPMSARADLLCRGKAMAASDAATSNTQFKIITQAGRLGGFANSAGGDAITANHLGQLVYAVDDNTLALTDGDVGAGPTRSAAGYFAGFMTEAGITTLLIEVEDVPTHMAALWQNGGIAPGAVAAGQGAGDIHVRGVVDVAIASLAAFTVAQTDVTYVENDVVALVLQGTGSQDGFYVVGEVAAGVAPLTRPSWYAAASVHPAKLEFVVAEGQWAGHVWYASATGAITVGTTDPDFYPRRQSGTTAAMVAGAVNVPNVWLKSATLSHISVSYNTLAGTTVGVSAPQAARTAGVPGTGEFDIAGGGSDTSTVDWQITN